MPAGGGSVHLVSAVAADEFAFILAVFAEDKRVRRRRDPGVGRLVAKQSHNIFWIGIFVDFVGSSTCTPDGAYAQMSGRNQVVDPHQAKVEPVAARTFHARKTMPSWSAGPAMSASSM